nr:phosphoglycerol transferase I [Klebsiella pneumoniae]
MGRWSNAQLGSDVKIEYKEPLPEKFDLVITAKAYGPNANKPIPVRVGESEQVLTLDNDVTTTTLHFDNPTRSNTLIITRRTRKPLTRAISSATPASVGDRHGGDQSGEKRRLTQSCPADFRAGQRLSWQDVNHTAAVVHQPTVR